MRQSRLFQKTSKEISLVNCEGSRNAYLLSKAGFINQLMAGVYSYMPLGLKVIKKIENIIRHEMDMIGANELLMPTITPRENWDKTGRWDTIDVLFKLKGAGERDLALNPTHEEIITPLAKTIINSYKDLPLYVYQIQTKFRNEVRAKSGILRGREFIMKDLYSFHNNESDLNQFYDKVIIAYQNIYKKLGLDDVTYKTYAAGGAFSKYSHEFQIISDCGEDKIYIIPETKTAINKEIINDIDALTNIIPNYKIGMEKSFITKNAIEVGNIFKLGIRFSSAFNLSYLNEKSEKIYPLMGCYGIGISRLMGVIAEILSDDKGLNWGEILSPVDVHLVSLCHEDKDIKLVDNIYNKLINAGIEVLYDDRTTSAGIKLSDSDLIGIYKRIVISPKTLKENKIEFKIRNRDNIEMIDLDNIVNYLQNNKNNCKTTINSPS